MKKYAVVFSFVAVLLSSCSSMKKVPANEFYLAAGSYEIAQIVMAEYVQLPTADPKIKKIIKQIDKRATDAVTIGQKAVKQSDSNNVKFAIGIIQESLAYI
ncbi:hypothetical protein D6827_03805, partial [Candidatus Parcubacteria bacterium]